MKITIEPETDEERAELDKHEIPHVQVCEGAVEFALVGFRIVGTTFAPLRRFHGDPVDLYGHLAAGMEYQRRRGQ